jgi:hypothetical protein
MTQEEFAQKLDVCETSYTEKMQNVHMTLEEEKAVEVSARVKARLLDAVRMHYQKAQAMTVMRSFSQWRQRAVLDKSNTMFLEVAVPSHHFSAHLISSHLILFHLMFSQWTLSLLTFPHLIPFHLIFSQRTLSLLTLSHLISPYSINRYNVSYLMRNIIPSHHFFFRRCKS